MGVGEGRVLPEAWGRKVARLPERGVLLVCTDLHGNWDDYQAMKDVYDHEEAEGNEPILVFTGDLVHGPNPELNQPGAWPPYLGTPYRDRSVELILDYEAFTRRARTFALMGNHEHAHVGGARVPKFYPDEAGVLNEALGRDASRINAFIAAWPLLAVSPSGVVLSHAAPRATEPDLEAFEHLDYRGYEHLSPNAMADRDTLGALLWARFATGDQASRLLSATRLGAEHNTFVAYGHDVVQLGVERFSSNQICVSTSFGLDDANKVYLRLDLARRYPSAEALRDGHEIRKLHPNRISRAWRSTIHYLVGIR